MFSYLLSNDGDHDGERAICGLAHCASDSQAITRDPAFERAPPISSAQILMCWFAHFPFQ